MSVINITGIKQSTGKTDNGFEYDHAVVFAVSMLDPTNTRCNGFAGIELRGVPAIYEKYLTFPFKAEGVPFEVQIEQVATGKGQFKDTIVKMIPVSQLQQAKASAIPPAPAK